jgi:hypothetical protein
MSNFITAKAKIIYDPKPGTKYWEPFWMYATTSFDFIKMYNYFCLKKGWRLDIGTPHSAHISVVKGEKPKNLNWWKWRNGETIEFRYEPSPYGNNNKHIWIDVYSDELTEIRDKLGLPYRKRFHITIGRLM